MLRAVKEMLGGRSSWLACTSPNRGVRVDESSVGWCLGEEEKGRQAIGARPKKSKGSSLTTPAAQKVEVSYLEL